MRKVQTCAWWVSCALAAACGGDGTGDCPDGTCDAAGCVESWLCSPWTTDGVSDSATRTCVDQSACGTTATKPAEAAMLPALDLQYYECSVEPVLIGGCAMLG